MVKVKHGASFPSLGPHTLFVEPGSLDQTLDLELNKSLGSWKPSPFQSGAPPSYNGLMVFTELGLSPYSHRAHYLTGQSALSV